VREVVVSALGTLLLLKPRLDLEYAYPHRTVDNLSVVGVDLPVRPEDGLGSSLAPVALCDPEELRAAPSRVACH
jgi:hypothetical protein